MRIPWCSDNIRFCIYLLTSTHFNKINTWCNAAHETIAYFCIFVYFLFRIACILLFYRRREESGKTDASQHKIVIFDTGGIKAIFLQVLKVLLLLPAAYRKGCIFGLDGQKNRIRTTEENKECLRSHVCHPHLRLGWQFTCDLGYSLLLLPRGVIYY